MWTARSGGGFQNGNLVVAGLLDTLAEVFYPKYAQNRAKWGPRKEPGVPEVKPSGSAAVKKVVPLRQRRARAQIAGLNRGVLVDHQLLELTQLCHHSFVDLGYFRVPPKPFVESKDALQRSVFDQIRKFRQSMSPETRLVVDYLCERGWRPVYSQLPVGDISMRVGTAVDLVVRDAHTRRLVVLEIKTGFDSYYRRHTQYSLDAPYEAQDDSPASQHQLQLAFTTAMFCQERFRSSSSMLFPVDAFVLRASVKAPRRLYVYPLEEWVKTHYKAARERVIHFSNLSALRKQYDKNARIILASPPPPPSVPVFSKTTSAAAHQKKWVNHGGKGKDKDKGKPVATKNRKEKGQGSRVLNSLRMPPILQAMRRTGGLLPLPLPRANKTPVE